MGENWDSEWPAQGHKSVNTMVLKPWESKSSVELCKLVLLHSNALFKHIKHENSLLDYTKSPQGHVSELPCIQDCLLTASIE